MHRAIRIAFWLFILAAPCAFAASNDIFVTGISGAAVRSSSTVTVSHTITNDVNRYLLVGVSISNTASVSSVTYGGTALTFVGGQSTTGSNERMEMWQLIAPAVGTANVVVTLTTSADIIVGAISFNNVNQTTPHRGFNSNFGQSTSATLTVPTFDRDMVVDTIVAAGGASSLTESAYQAAWWIGTTGNGAGDAIGAGSTQPGGYGTPRAGAGTVNEQWTLGKSRRWAIGAISLVPDIFPTAVRAVHGTVARCGATADIRWSTDHETGNVGFRVIREDARGRMTLTPAMVAGSFFATSLRDLEHGRTYRWIDREPSRLARYWIEDVDAKGRTTLHGPLAEVTGEDCETAAPPPSATIGEPVRAALPQVASLAVQTTASQKTDVQFGIAKNAIAKIVVDREGLYRVPLAQLVAAGLDPRTDLRKLQLFADGVEQAIAVTGNAIEFYGTGQDTPWASSRVYWLVAGPAMGKRIARIDAPFSGTSPLRNFAYAVERHDRNIYASEINNGDADNFFGPVVSPWAVATQTLDLPHVDATATEDGTLVVAIQGVVGEHSVDVAVNGHAAGTLTFGVKERATRSLAVPASWLVSGANTVTFTVAGPTDLSAIESVRIVYPHTYDADGAAFAFSAPGGQPVVVNGLAPSARVFDTTDRANVRELATASFLAPGSGTHAFFATATPLAPLAVVPNAPSSWNDKHNAAAVAIVTTRELAAALEPLRARRAAQYGSASIVEIEDLYDEFNFGAKSPDALRAFVLASRNWKTPPRYIVLAGDASFDPRGYLGLGDFDLVPTKLVGTAFIETASDDWFADLDGDGAADVPVGRIAVRTPAEAAAYVAKLLAYETQTDVASWSRRALVVNDANDFEYDFSAMADRVATTLAPAYSVVRATTRASIVDELNRGAGVTVYFGHGTTRQWSAQSLLTTADAPLLANGTKLPFVIGMTCLNAFFHDVYSTSLGESLVNAPGGGAIAMWTSSGLTFPPDQITMAEAMTRALAGSSIAIGDAAVAAKKTIGDHDVKATWILLGDPSMKLR